MKPPRAVLIVAPMALLLSTCVLPAPVCVSGAIDGQSGFDPQAQPESASAVASRQAVVAERQILVAAHPLASEAGLEILRAGGSAIDAAIAMQLVLNVVEPQSSGIGGGGFLLYFDAATGDVWSYEGRERAPAAATPNRFLDDAGEPLDFYDAAVGGQAVGVPALLGALAMAHRDHGRLAWADLFPPAIQLAEDGFPVSPRLHRLLAADEYLPQSPSAAPLFYPNGQALAEGAILKNPALAESLRQIAQGGSEVFYRGAIGAAIVAAVGQAWRRPGDLTLDDLAAYEPQLARALCGQYRDWRICAPPPPSSGGVALLQILGLLEAAGVDGEHPQDSSFLHQLAEASRLAFADRAAYLGDPDFMAVPAEALLAPDYIEARAEGLGSDCSRGVAAPGTPLPPMTTALAPAGFEPVSTSHLSAIDQAGNAVAMTSSIENAFGARLMVGGFLLNNQLTDFSFRPTDAAGAALVNAVAPGKQPRSSMTPILVFDSDNRLIATLGSPGGSGIIGYVTQALLALLEGGLDPQQAAALPHLLNRNGATELERGHDWSQIAADLAARGHEVKFGEMTSGLGILLRGAAGGWIGGADPRREGVVLGD